MSAPVEEWRSVVGARAEISNLGRIRDRVSGKLLERDSQGRVTTTTANGMQLRTIKSMLLAAWPEIDDAGYQRIRRHRTAGARAVKVITTPASGFGRVAGPTPAATLLSLAQAGALARTKGTSWKPHRGDDYARREPCTNFDRTAWLLSDVERLEAWTDAVTRLEAGAARASAAERDALAKELSKGM